MAALTRQATFTADIQNGTRLAALLINEGTAVLRDIFDREIKKTYPSLSEALKQNKAVVKNGDPARRIPKLVSPAQFNLLYPKKGGQAKDSSEFDLTLLSCLLSIVCGVSAPPSTGSWARSPQDQDHSLAADVIRLRGIRNEIYGHIKHTGVSSIDFENKWRCLTVVLTRLGVPQQDMERWRNDPLQPELFEKMEKKLFSLIEEDIADLQAIASCLLQVTESLPLVIKEMIKADLKEITDFVTGITEVNDFIAPTIFEIMDSLGEKLGHHDLMLKVISSSLEDNTDEIKKMISGVSSQLKFQTDVLVNVHRVQAAQTADMSSLGKTQEVILEEIQAQKEESKSHQISIIQALPKLDEIKHLYTKGSEAFRVLILNEPKQSHQFSPLAEALGFAPWDIILDLDHNALAKSGVYDNITQVLGKHKPVEPVTYKDLDKVTDEDKEAIAQGKKCIWIQANGCSIKDCEQSVDKFPKASVKISHFLSSLIKRIPTQKCVVCTTVLLNKSVEKQIGKLEEVLNEACIYADDVVGGKTSFATFACAEAGFDDEWPPRIGDLDKSSMVVRENQLTRFFLDTFQKELNHQFSYPGNKGKCYLTSEEMTQLLVSAELYHGEIGKLNFDNLEPEKISHKITDIRERYQKGGSITPQALHLNATGREKIYVKRKEMVQLEDALRKDLTDRKDNIRPSKRLPWRYMGLYKVDHDACGGATTCLRHVLYSIKDDYPCIELKSWNNQVGNFIKLISERSNLPVLIAVEGSSFATHEVYSLQARLSNDWVQGVLIHSNRMQPKRVQRHEDQSTEIRWYLSSKIEDSDNLAEFRELYNQGQSNKRANRIFLFGLLAFLHDFEKCDEHIHTCVKDIDTLQASILRIVCTIWKYSHIGVKSRLLMKFHKAESKLTGKSTRSEDSIVNLLGYANDILVNATDDQEDALRPAVDFVADRTLQYLHNTDDGGHLRKFTDDFQRLVKVDGDDLTDSCKLLIALLITRNKTLGLHWTKFVIDLEQKYGMDYVESVLKTFIELAKHTRQGRHIRTLYARYLLLQMRKPEEAILQIKQALGLEEGQSIRKTKGTENILLSAYGSIHLTTTKEFFSKALMSKGVNSALKQAESDIQEAVCAFEKAQKSTWNAIEQRSDLHIPVPFFMEATARHLILSLHMEHKCENDPSKFRKYLQRSNNQLLLESEAKGVEALDKLDLLRKLDKLNDGNPEDTIRRSLKLKFDFLRLQADTPLKQKIERTKQDELWTAINAVPDNIAFDIGSLVKSQYGPHRHRPWADLDIDELQFIITQIDKRIASSKALAKNYEDIITAMIYIRHIGYATAGRDPQRYGMPYAKQCASLWVNKSPEDFEAHFLLGVLTLVNGLETFDLKMVKDGLSSLSECRNICEKQKSTKSYRRIRYYIGKGNGLEKILPSEPRQDTDDVGRGRLETFTGRLVDEQNIVVTLGQCERAFIANIPQWEQRRCSNIMSVAKRQPPVAFNCAVAHDKVIAFNITLTKYTVVDRQEDDE